MKRDIIIFNKLDRNPYFAKQDTTDKQLEAYKSSSNFMVLEVGDTVTFEGWAHLEKDGKSKQKTGIIKKMGYSVGNCRTYPVCGIKVEGEEFGSALLYNYTMHPIALTKVK